VFAIGGEQRFSLDDRNIDHQAARRFVDLLQERKRALGASS